ncbi:MAG: hypothetical protein EP330_17865 [Deltaproteobacteria bacterium]|nr:MAG: hypothetical protein EP330_17865 [Deltaproteobacteria bacterium]
MSLLVPRFVTTAERPTPELLARAAHIAERCGLPLRRRNGSMRRTAGAAACYVVGKQREALWSPTASIFVHEGMTLARAADGLDHPLVRAVAPQGRASRIADGTLGLAQDALHLAMALDAEVLAAELSPVVFSLCEEGLPRLAHDSPVAEAAARITPRLGDSATVFAGEPDDSFDAVLVSPMFTQPDRAPVGYEAFRGAAVHEPLGEATVAEALRIAPRLVIKARAGEPVPPSLEGRRRQVLRGRALEYWVVEREGA